MHVSKLLHRSVGISCLIDKRLLRTLFDAAEALSRCRNLSIVAIGRSLSRKAKVKHAIKAVDRLFGNKKLQNKRQMFYENMTQLLLAYNKRPIIIVDWSPITPCGKYNFLRAGVAVGGRTLTIYEEAYHLSQYQNQKTHRKFLCTLKSILPKKCNPIIVTDAGFRNIWFRSVSKLGWDFVGRCRHNTYCLYKDNWIPIKSLYAKASRSAKYIDDVILAKSNPMQCYLYLMKQQAKHRIKKNLTGKKIRCSNSLKHAKRGNEPWLIVSSINHRSVSAQQIMSIYKKRMQIEESFRDLKNTRNGLGLRHCRSFTTERLNIALLIGALTLFALWVIGNSAKKSNLHYSFQTNTVRKRNVLSNYVIARQVLERRINISFTMFTSSLKEVAHAVA